MTTRYKMAVMLIVAILGVMASGCVSYRLYRIDSSGPELVLRRAESSQVATGNHELALERADSKQVRTVESLHGERVRLQVAGDGEIYGKVAEVSASALQIDRPTPESAIANPAARMYSVDLRTIDSLEIANSKKEAAIIAAVIVGAVAGVIAFWIRPFGASMGN